MILNATDIRAAYFCVAAVIRGRELHNHEVPPPVRALFNRLDAEVRMSRTRHESASDGRQSKHQDLIGVAEAAAVLGWSTRKVQRLAADLDGEMITGRWIFSKSKVDQYREGLADGGSRE
ncbi:hypothetical protein [Mycolicibacter virginiensis]|uniref:hypothetical protein n=1 Tax=Mycolicibacter virginiensis TaxID=1795032 RepID=UPI001F03D6AC|nr:hypothetical protein [Mycolicibacter virginiensis]ULP45942.1 hypothetical protein MJO54_13810 [Mycolicibacter virginiensis]